MRFEFEVVRKFEPKKCGVRCDGEKYIMKNILTLLFTKFY